MIYLYDTVYHKSKIWNERFEYLINKNNIKYKKIKDPFKEKPFKADFFIGRFNEKDIYLKKNYKFLNEIFHGRLWPEYNLIDLYNDKKKQLELFTKNNYPIPKTIIVEEFNDMDFLCFPLVYKKYEGSSSKNVKLVFDCNFELPCLLQDYIECKFDIRIICINEKVMGFKRNNRPNDFRASGSGLIEILQNIPKECVELSLKISRENNFSCMCFDFIKSETTWLLLEISYTFDAEAVNKYCNFYISQGFKFFGSIMPQDLVWDHILNKYLNKIHA